ncbi:MAG: sce7726 family protein [Bacteroidetes bacterium]|jgi:hypothetical protein|nr:sce7726 family protein [Bacteroidota bacterium]MBT6686105.1 sce7726 family protein [Bacteroidota bacterium]MBT7143249.1 sce7726 family protein [Bacteroidota bacterium]MBT7493405.1 sce7726 family protein [Bacteroidota bacterium]
MTINNNIESLRSLSQLFTTANFNRIIRKREYNNTFARVNKHISYKENITNLELFNKIYNKLLSSYKSEYIYKNILINKKLIKNYSHRSTAAINELKINKSIADFVLLNGEVQIFEIKTELDSLAKLETQIFDYFHFASKVYIVSSPKHISKLIKKYKETAVGIIELTTNNAIKEIKPAYKNTSFLKHYTIFKILRQNEYLEVLKAYSIKIPDVPNTKLFRECLNLSEQINIIDFQKSAIKILKKRNIKNPELLKSEKAPNYLKYICFSLDFSEAEYEELNSFLNKTNSKCISHT